MSTTPNSNSISYSDSTGTEYTETCTSPTAIITRAEELEAAGYRVNS